MQVAVLDGPGVDIEGDGVERTRDVHASGTVHVAVDGSVAVGDAQHLHPVELYVGVQSRILESAEQEAAGHGTLSVGTVREADILEMKTFRV